MTKVTWFRAAGRTEFNTIPKVGNGTFGRVFRQFVPVLTAAVFVGGCATGPQIKSVVEETFSIEASGDTSRQTKENITVEDMGEAQQVVQPMKVQACNGPHLRYGQREVIISGKKYVKEYPVYETVDPLQGIYIRRFKIRNDTEHVLRLNRIDTVLVDAAGNDNEGITKQVLEQNIRAGRSCSSTEALVRSLRSLKLLGTDTRIRPGRVAEVLAAFPSVDKRIVGDWTLELNDFTVDTNEAGEVSRVTSFKFPLLSKGYRTTIKMRKDSLFAPWQEIDRNTEEIEPSY